MTALDTVQQKLGSAEPSIESRGAYWFNPGTKSVREIAQAMNEIGARFVTITAYQLAASEGFRLEYHWDLQGQLLGVAFQIAGNTIESIFDLCEAVDWIEREIHEEYNIDFTGREYVPLLMRKDDALGVNLREEVKK
jgi:NADH:ubiquinone oxidoreductase subunit C